MVVQILGMNGVIKIVAIAARHNLQSPPATMNQLKSTATLGIACAVAGYFLFSAGDAMSKYMRQFEYTSAQISFQYSTTAVILLCACSGWLGGLKQTLKTERKSLHLLRGLVSAPTQAFNFYAFSKMPMANVYAVIFLTPFLTATLAAMFLKEKVTATRWLLIATGFVGVLIAMRPDVYGFSLPVVAVMVTAVFTSVRNTTVRLLGPQETALSLALYPAVAIALATSGPALSAGKLPTLVHLGMLSGGGLMYACGLLLTCLAFRFAPAALASPFHYTQIFWAVLAGLLLFGDMPDRWTILGSMIIILCGVGLTVSQSTQSPAELALSGSGSKK
ncbi:MAG: DMT family transporter [Pirellulaceae bacterium]|nr:DMT family transporter [Pirellulaceae bacterium]